MGASAREPRPASSKQRGAWSARRGRRDASGCGGICDAQAQVLDVVDGLVQQRGDVVVVQGVDDVLARAGAGDQAEVAQQAQLVGAGGQLHTGGLGQGGD